VIQIVLLAVFFGLLVVGALVADALGRLPTAEELAVEDRERMQRYERAF
jgi:hypothetical protein